MKNTNFFQRASLSRMHIYKIVNFCSMGCFEHVSKSHGLVPNPSWVWDETKPHLFAFSKRKQTQYVNYTKSDGRGEIDN